jgi:hypothetical protein
LPSEENGVHTAAAEPVKIAIEIPPKNIFTYIMAMICKRYITVNLFAFKGDL